MRYSFVDELVKYLLFSPFHTIQCIQAEDHLLEISHKNRMNAKRSIINVRDCCLYLLHVSRCVYVCVFVCEYVWFSYKYGCVCARVCQVYEFCSDLVVPNVHRTLFGQSKRHVFVI